MRRQGRNTRATSHFTLQALSFGMLCLDFNELARVNTLVSRGGANVGGRLDLTSKRCRPTDPSQVPPFRLKIGPRKVINIPTQGSSGEPNGTHGNPSNPPWPPAWLWSSASPRAAPPPSWAGSSCSPDAWQTTRGPEGLTVLHAHADVSSNWGGGT